MEALKSHGGAGYKPVMSPNVRHWCRLETPGGHFKNPQSATIMGIAVPRKPKIVGAIGVR